MSLDVYLTTREVVLTVPLAEMTSDVPLILGDEWDKFTPYARFDPAANAVVYSRDVEQYSANITHNLNVMADEAGIYQHLWRPDEIGITYAAQLIEPLADGLALLESDPARFSAFNPDNGWGSYNGLVSFVGHYLAACRECPSASVRASR